MSRAQTAPQSTPRPLVVGHRGAAGSRLEHTVPSYQLALEAGVDVLEPDLVVSADGALIVRHDVELSKSTDIARRPRFADRKRTLSVDGQELTGWFVHDFTLEELRELRCVERWPDRRPGNAAFDGLLPLLTFDDVVQLATDGARHRGSPALLWPELKSPTHFVAHGVDPVPLLVDALRRHGLDGRTAPVLVQCFEPSTLRRLAETVPVPRLQLLERGSRPFDAVLAGDERTFDDRLTDEGLAEMAGYATCLGVDKSMFGVDGSAAPGRRADVIERASRYGLEVYAWTFRNENAFLPDDLQVGEDPAGHGDATTEYLRYFDAGVAGVFTDHPATALAASQAFVVGRDAVADLVQRGHQAGQPD